jgi:hypothetical protein
MKRSTAVACGCLAVAVLWLGKPAPSQPSAAKPGALEGALTNADVVKLCRTGLSEEVIVAKINQAPRVAFTLETDDLIQLKQQRVSDAIVAAMLSRSQRAHVEPTPETGFMPGLGPGFMHGADKAEVRLATKEGEFPLKSLVGSLSHTYAYVKFLNFMDYPGLAAKLRTHDRRPSVLIASESDPRSRYFFVRTEVNEKDGDRSVKIGSGGLFRMKATNQPDSDWTLPFQTTEEKPGIWRIVLAHELEPGEYGIFRDGSLFDFGVDR